MLQFQKIVLIFNWEEKFIKIKMPMCVCACVKIAIGGSSILDKTRKKQIDQCW